MLLSIAYCPPLSWFAAAARDLTLSPDRVIPSVVTLEACENYQKQSWRNRCRIMTANGPENLQVPVNHEGGTFRLPIREIKVDYTEPWHIRTERAISSAYESTPYFEYYKDELFGIFDSMPETLWSLDLALIDFFIRKTGLGVKFSYTETYARPSAAPAAEGKTFPDDLREAIHPKREDTVLDALGLKKPYYQVFARKYGFVGNLSVMDLLFSEGPDSILWLHSL